VITNERQYTITKARAERFKEALADSGQQGMKAKREHRVPLSDAALRAIRSVLREGEYVFCGPRPDRPLSNMAMLALLRRMKRDDLTVHGFRSSFRDWAAEARDRCQPARHAGNGSSSKPS
jgi:integrase